MKKYVDFLYKFRWFIALGVPLLVIALASNLKYLEMDGSYRIWFGEKSKTLIDYDNFRKVFGNDDAVVIAFKDENGIFNKKALQSIENITNALWKMKYIARVDSITNYQYVHASKENPDDVIVEDFIQDIKHADEDYLNNRKEIAVHDSLIVDGFISRDAKTTMISARLVPKVNDGSDKSAEIMKLVKELLASEIKRTGYDYKILGGPALNQSFVEIGMHDAATFTPLVIIASIILLLVLFRRASGTLLPIGVVVFTFMIVLSVQVLLGYKLNNFTANLPVFVVAIGIADAVHMYMTWLMFKKEGTENQAAVLLSLKKNFLAIFLTSLTTAIGFATLTISKVIPVLTLGIATSSGAVLAFLISVVWVPTVLLLLKKDMKAEVIEKASEHKYIGYGDFILRNNKKIIVITTILFGVLAVGLFKVKVDSNTIRYFDKNVEIRKSSEFLMKNLTGPMVYEIVVDSGKKDGIKDPEFMKTVEKFYQDYQSKFVNVRHMSSLMDVVKRFNLVLNAKESIPNNQNLIAQYLLLYSLSLPQGMEISDKMDIDEQKLRISAQVNIVDTSLDLKMIDYAYDWWAKTPYKVELDGQAVMYAYMQRDVTDTLVYSLSMAVVLVSLVMLLIFRRVKLLWIFILPNILPVMLVVGLMGWLGINIDIGVAISGAIIIGVAVDDTIHFLVKYFDARKAGHSLSEAFDDVLHFAGRAILFTTLILSISFSLFAFSSFSPNQNFGIVTASALLLALVIDLLFLPALLTLADRDKQ